MRAILFFAALYLCLFVGGLAFAAPPAQHIPGTSVDGKFVLYAYISSRIIGTSPSNAKA